MAPDGRPVMSGSSDRGPADDPSEVEPDPDETAEAALNGLPDGVGCAEIWDYLSDHRRGD